MNKDFITWIWCDTSFWKKFMFLGWNFLKNSNTFNVWLVCSETGVFQWEILDCIAFTNENLYRNGLTTSPSCTLCQEVAKFIENLLSSCKISSKFWKRASTLLRDNCIHFETLTECDKIFGRLDVKEGLILKNHILLFWKYYTYLHNRNLTVSYFSFCL